jgi:hypothetical protein
VVNIADDMCLRLQNDLTPLNRTLNIPINNDAFGCNDSVDMRPRAIRGGRGNPHLVSAYPGEHWRQIHTNNPLERILALRDRQMTGAITARAKTWRRSAKIEKSRKILDSIRRDQHGLCGSWGLRTR